LQKKTPSALIPMTRRHSSSVTSTVASDAPGRRRADEDVDRAELAWSARPQPRRRRTRARRPRARARRPGAVEVERGDAAPLGERRRATAAPIPLDPPVTSATSPRTALRCPWLGSEA
jgi:hypothetical protein